MAAVDLLFEFPPSSGSPVDLVFGETSAPPDNPNAVVSGAITLVRPTLSGTAVLGIHATGSTITLARPTAGGAVRYHTDTQRPLAARTHVRYQEADDFLADVRAGFQDARKLQALQQAGFQDGQPLHASASPTFGDTDGVRRGGDVRFQDGRGLRGEARPAFQDAVGARRGGDVRFQDAARVPRWATSPRFQDGSAAPRNETAVRFQDAARQPVLLRAVNGRGLFLEVGLSEVRYQDAAPPPPGMRRPPVPPEPDPCYMPSPHLVFRWPWVAGGDLLFVCDNHEPPGPQPGATVVVPIRRIYMTTNTLQLVRADTGQPIACEAFSLGLDADSWTWSWSASVRNDALALLLGPAGDDPREVIATVNGVDFRLCAESISRERVFARNTVRVQGRGRNAMLDAPYAPVLNHSHASDRTAQQLMAQALEINGVGIGWDIEWEVADWLVPAGTWTHQGTHISAVLDIASAAGAIVQPHRTDQVLRILPRYPAMPRDWGDLTPDYELPADVMALEGIDWVTRPAYNRVHVAGTRTGGVLGEYTLTGSAGDIVAPMVTHPLLTHSDAARQRALPELANTGAQALMRLRMPVLSETGFILPGSLVRYVDTTVSGSPSRLGLVRGNALSWDRPTLRQTLDLETHEGI